METNQQYDFDFLVIGGGIAGLTFALEVAEHGSVAVLFKKSWSDSSTAWAQGGIAAVSDPDDNFEQHIADTLKAGDGLCDAKIVRLVVEEGPERVRELIARGARFDSAPGEQGFHLHKEGGHSKRRIYHAADATGWEIQRALAEAVRQHPNIVLLENRCAIDLITGKKLQKSKIQGDEVHGAYVLNEKGEVEVYRSRCVLMATGGAGKVYLYTSNPDVATGDGIAMCYRAGAPVANLEFFQFHPTCLFHPQAKSFLITEAMRGEGAILRRINGERFMPKYDERAELAPRDIVARAIDSEMKRYGEEYVLLDITHRDEDFIRSHFPTIYERCLHFGYDISKQAIPVVPAAHYCCGGVITDEHARTKIQGLYVAGETAHTGLHGANRLASNSLLEGMVFAYRAAKDAIREVSNRQEKAEIPPWDMGIAVHSDEAVVITQNWDEIRRFMWNYVGIVRSDKRLERALRRSEVIEQEIKEYYWHTTPTADFLELRNLSKVANLVIQCAMARKESRGLHYTIDYPEKVEGQARDVVLPQ